MKKLIYLPLILTTLTVSLTTLAHTEVIPPTGSFAFNNNTELLTLKKTETVPMINQSALEHVIELKKQGWTCTQQAGNYNKCSMFFHNETLPESIFLKIQSQFLQHIIQFADVKSIAIINNAEFVQEYDVNQSVQYKQLVTENYLLRVVKDGPVKLQIPFAGSQQVYFNLVDEKTIATYETLTTFKNNISTLYFIQVNFEKIP